MLGQVEKNEICMVPVMFRLFILFVRVSVDVENYWKFSLVLFRNLLNTCFFFKDPFKVVAFVYRLEYCYERMVIKFPRLCIHKVNIKTYCNG